MYVLVKYVQVKIVPAAAIAASKKKREQFAPFLIIISQL
jgi:hypothetical protein